MSDELKPLSEDDLSVLTFMYETPPYHEELMKDVPRLIAQARRAIELEKQNRKVMEENRYQDQRCKAYNEQFLKDKDEKAALQSENADLKAQVDRLRARRDKDNTDYHEEIKRLRESLTKVGEIADAKITLLTEERDAGASLVASLREENKTLRDKCEHFTENSLRGQLAAATEALANLYEGTAWSSIGTDDVWRAVRNQSRPGTLAEALAQARAALQAVKGGA